MNHSDELKRTEFEIEMSPFIWKHGVYLREPVFFVQHAKILKRIKYIYELSMKNRHLKSLFKGTYKKIIKS